MCDIFFISSITNHKVTVTSNLIRIYFEFRAVHSRHYFDKKMRENILLCLIVTGCSLVASQSVLTDTLKENTNFQSASENSRTRKLSRHKRYLAFPDGSSFAVIIIWVMLRQHDIKGSGKMTFVQAATSVGARR